MPKWLVFNLLPLMCAAIPLEAHSANSAKACSKAEALAAEDVIAALKTWAAVHDAYVRFAHCDDGSIGEGFSESITILLSRNWGSLNQFRRAAIKDKGFEAFVLKHIDFTVPVERLETIAMNAQQRCGAADALCVKIATRAMER